MLTQQRHEIILKLLKEKGSITVTEVRDLLDTSESTVRRDITALDKEGKLEKVFGGAVEAGQKVTAHEYTVAQKNELKLPDKSENQTCGLRFTVRRSLYSCPVQYCAPQCSKSHLGL